MKNGDRKVTFWYGWAFESENCFTLDDFNSIAKEFENFDFHVVLSEPSEEDDWKVKKDMKDEGDGFLGFVHNAVIEHQLSQHDARRRHRVLFLRSSIDESSGFEDV